MTVPTIISQCAQRQRSKPERLLRLYFRRRTSENPRELSFNVLRIQMSLKLAKRVCLFPLRQLLASYYQQN